jgi:hypothetical protein
MVVLDNGMRKVATLGLHENQLLHLQLAESANPSGLNRMERPLAPRLLTLPVTMALGHRSLADLDVRSFC